MSFRRTLAILRKELHHITRDPRIFFTVTLSPAFLLLTLSYVFSFDVDRVTLAVMDLDQSPTSRAYLSQITSNGDFEIKAYVDSYEQAESLLLSGDARTALVIPHGFEADVKAGRPVEVQAVVDGTDAIGGRQSVRYLDARTNVFAVAAFQRNVFTSVISVRSRAWYNPSLKSVYSMVPGLSAIVLFMPALAVTLALAREKETGSFEGLIATPVRGPEYLAGKVTAYMLTGLVGTVLTLLVAVHWFHVPFHGNVWMYLLLTCIYFSATMGIGIFVANFVSSQQAAMTIVLMAFFVPSFFLAGLILPPETRSLGGKISSYALPTTHFVVISRAIYLKGTGLAGLWEPTLFLLITGAAFLGLSLLLFRKKLG